MRTEPLTVRDLPGALPLPEGHRYRVHVWPWIVSVSVVDIRESQTLIVGYGRVIPWFGKPRFRHAAQAAKAAHMDARARGHL